jgi:hypothetical protein
LLGPSKAGPTDPRPPPEPCPVESGPSAGLPFGRSSGGGCPRSTAAPDWQPSALVLV